MSKEQQKLLDEAYKNYGNMHWISPFNPKGKLLSDQSFRVIPMEHSKESFINEIKTNPEFSEKWGLKIEERELSDEERQKWVIENIDWIRNSDDPKHEANKYLYRGEPLIYGDTIPTKLITITYNDKTIESYINSL